MSELEKVWNPIAEGLYKNESTSGFTGGGNQSNPFGGFDFGQANNPFSGQ